MAEVPVPGTTAEEEEALFGPGPAQGAGHPGGNTFVVPGPAPLPTQPTAQPAAATGSPTSAPPAQSPQVTGSGVPTFGPDAMLAFMAEMLSSAERNDGNEPAAHCDDASSDGSRRGKKKQS